MKNNDTINDFKIRAGLGLEVINENTQNKYLKEIEAIIKTGIEREDSYKKIFKKVSEIITKMEKK